jgi:hypothetical protein
VRLFRDAAFGILCAGLLAGCASPVPPLGPDQTAVIPGSATADQDPDGATRTVLLGAARLTVDHGFQYFQIVRPQSAVLYGGPGYGGPITPGADVTIKVYQKDAVPFAAQGLWDANKLLAEGVPDSALATATPSPAPATGVRNPPHCTAYGCVW